MKLHLSGVKLPKLGTIQDRVYREYLIKEAQLEAKKLEMVMLLTLTNPSIEDPNRRRDWAKAIKTIWTQTLSLLLNVELPEQTAKEMEMLEYYQNVVKNSELKLFKDKMGKLHVSGVDKLLQKP
jgi:hypothetical protein